MFEVTFQTTLGILSALLLGLIGYRLIEGAFFWIGFIIGQKQAKDKIIEELANRNKVLEERIEGLIGKAPSTKSSPTN
jgi:cell division protein FtsB